MNILHICISERYVEGDSYHENILPTKHQKMGHKVTVIASQDYFDGRTKSMKHRGTADYYNKDGIHVIILSSSKKNILSRLLSKSVEGLYGAITRVGPDIIFVHGVKSPDNKAVAKYVKNNPQVHLFADNHNDYRVTPLRKGFIPWLSRLIAARNARLLLPVAIRFWGTLPLRAEYLNMVFKIPKNKIGVLIMGGDDDIIRSINKERNKKLIRNQYGIPEDAFLIVTGGVFDKRKQQNLLMEAVKQTDNEKVWLLAFGEPAKEMENVFLPFKSENRIKMTGWLPSDKAYELFMASDLAFFPGWHSVLWEQAVACGLPIVVKYWEGVDHVSFNGNAVLMKQVNVETIKKEIEGLCFTTRYNKMLKAAKEAAPYFYMGHIANKAIGIE